MKKVDIYLAADTSFYDAHPRDRIVAHILEMNGKRVTGANIVTRAYGNEAALTGLLIALHRLRQEVDVAVHADSTYLESQINTGNIYSWQKSGGMRRGDPIRYHDKWIETIRIINEKCPYRIKCGREVPEDRLKMLKISILEYKKGGFTA